MTHNIFRLIALVLLTFVASTANSEVVTIDVTVKAVDASSRSITFTKASKTKTKDIELEVGKKAKIQISGKDASLDDVKTGQKASVSYETELEVVTKIEIPGSEVDPSPDSSNSESTQFQTSGCRVVWSISETGDSTLTISRPIEGREAATDSMVRHDDGTVEFQHDLKTQESVDKAMMGGSVNNVEFASAQNELVFKPNTEKGYDHKTAHFTYSKLAQLPLTIEYEFEFNEPSGKFPFGLNVRNRRTDTEFPFLNIRSEDDLNTTAIIECVWHARRGANGKAELQTLLMEEAVDLTEPKTFQFQIPANTNDTFTAEFGKAGVSTAVLKYVSVRGRLKPTMGVGLADKNGGVIADKVFPNGLGESVGIKQGDQLMSINGEKPKSMKDAIRLLATIQLGEESEIVVKRKGKTVKIGFTPE